jgi:hypothetical protein
MTKVTSTTRAWLPDFSHIGPEDFRANQSKVIDSLCYTNLDLGKGEHPYTLVGTATITVDYVGDDTLIANKVAALKAELQTVRAEAQNKVTRIEEKINRLLAITNEAEPA